MKRNQARQAEREKFDFRWTPVQEDMSASLWVGEERVGRIVSLVDGGGNRVWGGYAFGGALNNRPLLPQAVSAVEEAVLAVLRERGHAAADASIFQVEMK